MKKLKYISVAAIMTAIVVVIISSCKDEDVIQEYTIGGSVSGLNESTYVVLTNGSDEITISENGPYTFPTPLLEGETYDVKVKTNPVGQAITIENGSGTAFTNVTNISVTCSNNSYSIGGTVSGLAESASIVLTNGSDEITVTEDGPFTFPTQVENGGAYEVKVKTNPVGQTSAVENAKGTVNAEDVTNVNVSVTNTPIDTYLIGGSVSGLSGGTLVLVNGSEEITITENGGFTFPTPVADGSSYDIKVKSDPEGQQTTIANGKGVVDGADVKDVTATCEDLPADKYLMAGTMTGLDALNEASMELSNGIDTITIDSDGPFVFPTPVDDGYAYTVSIITQPTGGFCTVENGSGTVSGANVKDIEVNCEVNEPIETYRIGGTISGLSGGTIILVNGEEEISVSENGTFSFPTPVPDGTSYDIKVKSDPEGQQSTIENGKGAVDGANVENIVVTCADLPPTAYLVGGEVTGMAGGTLILANGDDELEITSDGPFQFPTPVDDGATYDVTIKSQPSGGFCTVENGEGTVDGANVTDVAVTCTPTPTYTVGGTISGLNGTLVIANNGVNQLTITENGPFTFTTPLADGSAYEVTVVTQPDGELCSIVNGTGTIDGANVSNVEITCQAAPEVAANYYAVSDDAKFYAFQADKSLLAKSGKGLTDFSSVTGLAYDSDNDILYGFSTLEGTLLSINRTTGEGTAIADVGTTEIADLAYDKNADKLYGVNYSFGQLLEINVTTGAITSLYTDAGLEGVFGLAYDPINNKLYGTNSSEKLLLISITPGAPTVLESTFGVSRGLAYDTEKDRLYGVYAEGSNDNAMTLFTFKNGNGLPAKVGTTGLLSSYGAGLAYVDGDDKLMASSGLYLGPPAKLYEVDRSDGTTVSIGSTGYDNYSDLAWRDVDQLVYGLDLSNDLLLTFDVANGTTTFKREPYFDATTRLAVGLTYKSAADGFYTVTKVLPLGLHLTFIDAASDAAPLVNGNKLATIEDEIRALAYDNVNGILYVATLTGIAIIDEYLGTIVEGSKKRVAINNVIKAMNFDPNKEVLVATTASGQVIAIDPATGDFVEVTTTSETLVGITYTEQ